ncbi:flagellar assembly protein T N-terminal domain-containing protein [Pseudoalteromonas xiamenensis]|uniref:Flagella assembly protein FlgT n=1 Tax=Pseudoalteromonas xiamenensis TaxID=882626 RepID=A0A975DFQ5_9GAMM|nr:flagellar assembly protein T N-terminal domain-containing protein [Pseudoalteromonas xiamenensis]QTH71011.1 flagella assembly protein FlgT [Pseudoalteromonas xiamenensis]
MQTQTRQYTATLKACCFLVGLGVAFESQAEWFESTGYAVIDDGDIAKARHAAIKDAVRQALIFSGASVSSVQTIADGVLSQDQVKIKSHGEVQQINLIEERQESGQFSVTLHLDIFATHSQCKQSKFNKQVAVTRSQLLQPQQARMGQIYDLPEAASRRLFETLNSRNMAVKPVPYIAAPINVKPFFSQQFDYKDGLIEEIATRTNSQFVIFSQITDIADGEQQNSDYAFWEDDSYKRSFKANFALFDALTMEPLWQQYYTTEGTWPFKKTQLVDVNSNQFWRSDYGDKIQEVFNKVSYDLSTAVSCLPTKGKILHIDGNRLVVNLGLTHGVKEGQLMSIAHRSDLSDNAGKRYSFGIQTINQLRVVQVNQQSAIVENIDKRPLSNIQLNDIIVIETAEDDGFGFE